MYRVLKKITSLILLLSLLFSNIAVTGMISAYAGVSETYLDELLKDMKAPYDIMIRLEYFGADRQALSRKERATLAQKELLNLLEEEQGSGNVEKYEAFYIANGVHAIIKTKDLIYRIASLENVVEITKNSKIELIKPIEEKKSFDTFGTIFEPDERRIEWGVSMVHADKVWENYGITGKGITVGIIDTGVNYKLPALRKSYKGYNAATGEFDRSYYKDFVDGFSEPLSDHVNDHGTHVAGTIAGTEGEKINRIGVAPGVKFISARALNDQGGETSNLLAAAEWMLEQKPDVINNSWGGDSDADKWFYDVAQAWKEEGIVGVFAAGNQGGGEPTPGLGSVSNPGNMLNVLTVGAVDINKKLGSFSKKGPSAFDDTKKIIKPEVVAPGVQVRSIDALGNYVSWNGTSMATPHVVGVIALIKEANPNIGVEEIINILEESAEPLSDRQYAESPNMAYGYGLVNAYDAVSKIKGSDLGSVYGKILKEGRDTSVATAEFKSEDEAYIGRAYNVNVKIKDDISIKDAKVYYKFNASTSEKNLDLKLDTGEQNDGLYKAVIEEKELEAGSLYLRVVVKDYADNITEIKKQISVNSGVSLPWSFDFENDLSGFIVKGNWALSKRLSNAEPPMREGSKQYIGIDGGSPTFKRSEESYLYLPPVDVSKASEDDNLSLTADVYNGFLGISRAEIQAKLSTDKEWKVIYETRLRPDITERRWERNTYSLRQFAGSDKPLLIRFYFLGREEGPGWYLDNLEIRTDEKLPPAKVKGLISNREENGLKLSFIMNEEPDMKDYIIEKSIDGGEFVEFATINQGYNKQFIDDGKSKTHYRMSYADKTVEDGKKYTYRIKARDISGNISEASDDLTVNYGKLRINVSYDFEGNDGGFTPGIAAYEVNDWEYGNINLPEDWQQKTLIYRNIYEGINTNKTKVWGTKLNEAMSHGGTVEQDSYLMMPEFTVEEGDYFYFDTFSIRPNFDRNVSFNVEIKEENTENWQSLFRKELIQGFGSPQQWHTISTSMDKYKGKTVSVRFRAQSNGGIHDDYNLGWYIDNIYVGEKKNDSKSGAKAVAFEDDEEIELINDLESEEKEEKGMSPDISYSNIHTFEEESLIPAAAKITVLETGKYTTASIIDGTYKLGHAVNSQNNPYTVAVSAYGYETQISKVDLSTEHNKELNFVLKPAKKSLIKGIVKDALNNPLQGVSIKITDDDNMSTVSTDASGMFEYINVYTGEHRLRIYKEGYLPKEVDIKLGEQVLSIEDTVLEKLPGNLQSQETDYGFTIEKKNGSYQSIHFRNSMKGNAVRFQAPYEGAILKSVKLFLVNNDYYAGNHIQIGIIGYDNERRLRELAPFKEYPNLKKNDWNEIDLGEYNIKRDEPIYVATRYEKGLSESMALYYDTSASSKAKSRSFIYDGAFTKTEALSGAGAFAVKATWLYEPGAKENKESDIDDTSRNNGGNIRPTEEPDFEFDEATQTITKYKGNNPDVSIPKKIKGIEVRHIGEAAFNGLNKPYEVKIKSLIIPEGIETIGKGAFKNNRLSTVKLPESLREIDEEAFRFQYKDSLYGSTEFKINIPENVKLIKKYTFESAGDPVIVEGAKELLKIENSAFTYNKKVEINAPKLSEIESGAFGTDRREMFEYAKVYTDVNTKLTSKTGEYLINPALVKIKQTDAKDKENVLKIGLKYGNNNPQSYGRNNDASAYYKIGETITIKPYDIEKNSKLYTSMDKPIELKLERENIIEFYYYLVQAQVRLPVFDTDKVLPGFTLPNADIKVKVSQREYRAQANEDGFFEIDMEGLNAGDTISILANSKPAGSFTVEAYTGKEYIVKDNNLLRYMGNEKNLTIPVAVSGAGDIKEIGNFALYGKGLKTVIIPEKVSTVGAGAFMDNDLESFGFNLNNINLSSLRIIKEYAFKNNKLKAVNALPELTHVIQTKAFENNELEKLVLSKYLGHIGKAAFKNNHIKDIDLPGNLEDIEAEAFMNNEISGLRFLEAVNASEHMEGVSHLGEKVFANNRFTTVELSSKIKTVDETAFEGNKTGVPTLKTDSPSIVATKNFHVLRSDGTLLEYGKNLPDNKPKENQNSNSNKETDSSSSEKGFGGGSGSGGSHSGNSHTAAGGVGQNHTASALPKGYIGATKLIRNRTVPANVVLPKWIHNTNTGKWMLVDENGEFFKDKWVLVYTENAGVQSQNLPYAWFRFDKEAKMQTGWIQENGATYYLQNQKGDAEGIMQTGWQKIDGKWYYFETNFGADMGKLYTNRLTPDSYYVGKDGVWEGNKQ